MNNYVDKGFFSHTATARPYWGGDVNVTSLRPAPRLHAGQSGGGFHNTIAKLVSVFSKR